ncbi:MAG: MFS transporter [Candidatus Helarchaeota archaeon]
MKKRELYTIIVFIIIASLDNAALALIPAILDSVAVGVHVPKTQAGIISFAVSVVTFMTALMSFLWGYSGDKYSRKKLLLYGTIIWVIFIFLTGFSQNFTQLFIFQLLAGVGLGCIASVGFSIIIDFVTPQRRGLALSLWGLSQGMGNGIGIAMAVLLNASLSWNWAFWILSGITVGFLIAYGFTVDPERGATEEELQSLFESGETYDYTIRKEDLRYILSNFSNKLLILQGLFAQVGWGGLALLPVTLIFKLQYGSGVPEAPARIIGPLIAGFFMIGGIFSILFGWLGDKYQKKTLKARPLISALGVLIGIPLVLGMLLVPFKLEGVPNTNDFGVILGFLVRQLVSNPLFLLTFLLALFAAIFSSADAPNFFALVGDINLPEHRTTFYGFTNFVNGIGRTSGLIILPMIQMALGAGTQHLSPTGHEFVLILPLDVSWVFALSITLLFFIPAGICYAFTIRTIPRDIQKLKEILKQRAEENIGKLNDE